MIKVARNSPLVRLFARFVSNQRSLQNEEAPVSVERMPLSRATDSGCAVQTARLGPPKLRLSIKCDIYYSCGDILVKQFRDAGR